MFRSSTNRLPRPGSDARRRHRALRRLLLFLLAGLAPLSAAWAALDRASFVALGASMLRVEALRERGGYALGSGVTVGADKVVTNCHVTREARQIHVVRGGARWVVAAQAVDLDHDLCLLRVPGLTTRGVALGRAADLRVGQPVIALGFTGGLGMSTSAGEVVELHHHDGANVIRSSNRFNSGASGGGLFDDDGRLVGILTFRLRGGEAHYFAAPAEWVQQMLDDPAPGAWREVMPLAATQLPYWERPVELQPEFLRRLAPTPGRSGPSPYQPTAQDFSTAEQALFIANHLAALRPPATLNYSYRKSGSLEEGFEDSVAIALRAQADGSCCSASAAFLNGARRLSLPEVDSAQGNPVILYFLERDIREMQRLTKGQHNYFRKRIRMAVYQGATVRPVTLPWRGREVAGREITITPYLDDPLRVRFEKLAAKQYVFTLSEAVPGGVYALRTHIAGASADAPPLIVEEMRVAGAPAASNDPPKKTP